MKLVKPKIYFLLLLVAGMGLFGYPTLTQEVTVPILNVYLVEYPPHSQLKSDGNIGGEMVKQIKAFLDRTNLKYKISLSPWRRGFRSATQNNNVLIGYLVRNKDREEKFHWFLPMITTNHHLIARNDPKYKNMILSDVLSGEGLAICNVDTVECQLLESIGFEPKRIVRIAGYEANYPLAQMVLRGRADFWLGDLSLNKEALISKGISPSKFTPLFKLFETTSYLAASKGLHPHLYKRLRDAMVQKKKPN